MKAKSYNKVPSPFVRFFAYLAVGIVAVAALRESAFPVVIKTAQECWVLLFGAPAPSGETVELALLAGLVVIATALTVRDWTSFHDGVWLGERPSSSRACGNARLLSSPGDLRRAFCKWKKGVRPKPGAVVGGVGSRRDELLIDDYTHMLCIGGTGAGKSVTFTEPTVVELAVAEGSSSAVVLDPKGELYALTAACAAREGKKVVLVDFSDVERSDGWNPLSPAVDCAKGRKGRAPTELPGELRVLASMLVPERTESAPIWSQAARILFCGIAAYVCESPSVPDRCRNLSTVASIATMDREDLGKVVGRLDPSSTARIQLDAVLNAPEETYGGFRMNLNSYLNVYADPSISGMLARSDFSAEDFLEGDLFLYVRFSGSSQAYDALVAALVGSLMGSLRRLAEGRCQGTLPHPVYWVLEEFGQLPAIPDLPRHLSVVRSQGMHFALVVQSRAQVTARYREDAATVFNNLDTTLFLASSDKDTCKHYSELLGSYTVETTSRSRTKGSSSSSTGSSVSCREARLFRTEDLEKWDWRAGHLVIKRGQAYACSSLSIQRTLAGELLGLGGREPNAKTATELRPERAVKNPEPAPVWDWRGEGKEGALDGIAAAIDATVDPRWI